MNRYDFHNRTGARFALRAMIGCVIAVLPWTYASFAADAPGNAPLSDNSTVAPPTPTEEQPEVITRGPVHESFAAPVDTQPQATIVAPKDPPASIQETPPNERPQGNAVVWIPGYWAWDADRTDYIWISGCWRTAPPQMYWVPGYWSRTDRGWEWVPGFWSRVGSNEIEYLPAPPTIAEAGPPPAPSEEVIWVPPCYYWHEGRYVLRNGYWLTPQPDWVWVPSHYVWTPRGYVFAEGHWDYAFERRGVLFAPVYYHAHHYPRAYVYSPSVVIDIGALEFSLFAYPRYSHYYFGDYYDATYVSIGIYPWYECSRFTWWYDPIYCHDRWRNHRSHPHWDDHIRREYDRRQANRDLRPARTFREMETRVARAPEADRRRMELARPLAREASDSTARNRFEKLNDDTRRQLATQSDAVSKFRDDRSRWERRDSAHETGTPTKASVPTSAQTATNAQRPDRTDRTTRQPDRTSTAQPSGSARQTGATTPTDGGRTTASDRRDSTPTRVERRDSSGQAGDQRGSTTAQPSGSTPSAGTATPTPATGNSPSTPSRTDGSDRRTERSSSRSDNSPSSNQPSDRREAPRDVNVNQPECVQIPSPPTYDRGNADRSSSDRSAPARPDGEGSRGGGSSRSSDSRSSSDSRGGDRGSSGGGDRGGGRSSDRGR